MSTPAENANSTLAPADAAPVGADELRLRVIDALRKIYDPEIPVNIYDLGLIYGIDIDAQGAVHLRMTLTSPGCPVAQTFPATVEAGVGAVTGVMGASVELVWEPSWGPDRMTEAAKLQLGML
ncbi:MAG: DUF59 domain-containing protein [Pseudomonadota bacterium]